MYESNTEPFVFRFPFDDDDDDDEDWPFVYQDNLGKLAVLMRSEAQALPQF